MSANCVPRELPPLVSSMTSPVGVNVLNVCGLINEYDRYVTSRSAGGKGASLPKNFRPAKTGMTASQACLQQHRANKDPYVDPPGISGVEASRGVISLIERGLLPCGSSVDGLVGTVAAQPASLHSHVESFRRQNILTGTSGFYQLLGVKYDIAQIEKIHPKALNYPTEVNKRYSESNNNKKSLSSSSPPLHDTPQLPPLKEREDSRNYAQLLDLYSLHEFIIRKGTTLRNTPEFASYKRSYAHQWGSIEQLLKELEVLLQAYGVPFAYVDGKRLAALARVDLGIPSKNELLECIANNHEVAKYISKSQQYLQQGPRGQIAAACKIQATYRMHLAQRRYRRLRVATWAARIIQVQWACHKGHKKTRNAISAMKEALTLRWRDTMEDFISKWDIIKRNKRTIIHLPSLSYPTFQCKKMPFYHALQGSQLMRLADLKDPLVDVIIVSPFKIDDEALQYYINSLKAAGVQNPEGRLVILVPENVKRLPASLSLTKIVLFSTNVMRILSSITRGKTAYIVPEMISLDEMHLAAKLNLPLLCTEPRLAPFISTKSGQKSILEAANVEFPVGAYHIKTIKEMYLVLARFIEEYRDIGRWVVKIDNESGGRGHAIFDVLRLRSVTETPDCPVTVEAIMAELCESAGKRVKILNTTAYPDWFSYCNTFNTVGGCVEAIPSRILASPTVNMFIEPDGNIRIESVVENVFSPVMNVLGCTFPQTVTPYEVIRDAALNVASIAFRKKVLGYFSVDFIVHEKKIKNTDDREIWMWCVDIDLQLTNNACMHNYIMLVTGSKFDQETGSCGYINSKSGQLTSLKYIYSGLFYNPYIGAIRHSAFFNLCRQKGLLYDINSHSGVLFHLVDVLLKSCMGVVCIGHTFSGSLQLLFDVQQLVQSELPREAENVTESNYGSFVAAVKHLCSLKALVSDKNNNSV